MAGNPNHAHELAMSAAQRQAAIRLIDQWLREDSGYDQTVWPLLQQSIEENRLSNRPRFPEQRRQ